MTIYLEILQQDVDNLYAHLKNEICVYHSWIENCILIIVTTYIQINLNVIILNSRN